MLTSRSSTQARRTPRSAWVPICDDQALVRAGFRAILESKEDLELVVKLAITEATVKTDISSIQRKLGLCDRTAAALVLIGGGIGGAQVVGGALTVGAAVTAIRLGEPEALPA